jgi:hypothetical protein
MSRWHKFDGIADLPERAFQPRGWKGSMTLEGGFGAGSAPSPDPNIGIAQRQMADLSTEQWNTFKSDIYPKLTQLANSQEQRANEQWQQDKELSAFNLNQAKQAYQRYENTAIPALTALQSDANNYNSRDYQEELAHTALGDVNANFENQRQQEAMRERSYGIDPTSGAAIANNQSIGVTQALAGASAMNQVRQAAHDLGIQKQANVYSLAAGLPGQGNANMGLSLNANAAGFNVGQSALGNYGAVNANLGSAAGSSMQGWGNVANTGLGLYQGQLNAYNVQAQNNPWNMMLGAAAGVGTRYALGKVA